MRSYRGRGRAAFLAAGLWLGVLTIAQALADCLRRNPSGAQAGVNRSRWTMQLGAKYRF